ncbi:RING/U-box superfamily protein [Raphanus sativus]|uniref:Uncharacterized protein LOC108832883 n=1 Tax=Raphanus sativus TaxID=3726 RepID=A0A6J0LNL5_RAPSA|nr:uncharacterized protein LOC108832883 [Raphanus sativus]KAJ4885517.1 RING/U-box superfamily protein [Raphanus sativus]
MVWFGYCDDEPDSFISFDPVFTNNLNNNPNFVFDFVLVYRKAPRRSDSDSDDDLEDFCNLDTRIVRQTHEFDRAWLVGGDREQIEANVFHILEIIQVPSFSDIVHTLTIDILDLKKHESVSDSPEIERIRVEIDTIVPSFPDDNDDFDLDFD